jgi:hypothetical protein
MRGLGNALGFSNPAWHAIRARRGPPLAGARHPGAHEGHSVSENPKAFPKLLRICFKYFLNSLLGFEG